MSRFDDTLPTHQGWLHELARTELLPDSENLLHMGKSFEPQQLVEESSIQFMSELKEHFTEYARLFNAYSDNNTRFQDIKVYSIAQTPADFMLFRNQVKLVVSNAGHGVIQISFAQHVRGNFAVNGQEQKSSDQVISNPSWTQSSQELLAQLGPFRDVFWSFQGEKVIPEQVAKFYFSEFVKVTRDLKRSRAGNQLLLDQIKALLQEKGLDL